MTYSEAILLAIVEGLTEFLPISSTGHMILVSHFMNFQETPFHKAYMIIIQFAAILSVMVMYFDKLKHDKELWIKIMVGFIPAAVAGLALKNFVDQWLESVHIVAWALIIGGIIFLVIDRIFKPSEGKSSFTRMQSFWIGCFQTIALIPGVSRSGATIIGGLVQGLDRKTAAEYSFLLAIPTMLSATVLKVMKLPGFISDGDLMILLTGCVISFIVAWLSIRFMIYLVTKYGFWHFGIYRIIVGSLVLIV